MSAERVPRALRWSMSARDAWRALSRSPKFALVAIGILSISIGAAVSTFSVVDAVLLRPLPYANANELVSVHGNFRELSLFNIDVAPGEFFDYRERTRSFSGFSAYQVQSATLALDATNTIAVQLVSGSANLPTLLGARALGGRLFRDADDAEGAAPVALISAELWRAQFDSKPGVIGSRLLLNGQSVEIIGVMPSGFTFPVALGSGVPDVWTVMPFTASSRRSRDDRSLDVIARIKAGTSLATAEADLVRVASGFVADYPMAYPHGGGGWKASVVALNDSRSGGTSNGLLLALGAVLLMLTLSCTSVANLFLSRAALREREVAIRLALGATRADALRQLLVESLIIGTVASALGLAVGAGALSLAKVVGVQYAPLLAATRLDTRLVLFSLLLAFVTSVLFGLPPALSVSRLRVTKSLSDGSRSATTSRRHKVFRMFLTSAEVALALVLTTGTGLLVRSFSTLMREGAGFRTADVYKVRVQLSNSAFPDTGAVRAYYRNVDAALRRIPGVTAVSASHVLPLNHSDNDRGFIIEGRPIGPGSPPADEQVRFVFPMFSSTLDIPVVTGRDLTAFDNERAPRVVLVNRALAAKLWPGESAIGKRIALEGGMATPQWSTVVGIIGDTKHSALDAPAPPILYVPAAQMWQPPREMNLLVRTQPNTAGIAQNIREQLAALDASRKNFRVVAMSELVGEAVAPRRFVVRLLSVFAVVALTLASFGLYAVVAYAVQQRANELGIRMALGATPRNAVMLVLRDGVVIILTGLALGLLMLLPLSRMVSSQLYGIGAWDATTLAAVAATLIGCALLACYIPARAATRISPQLAMHNRS